MNNIIQKISNTINQTILINQPKTNIHNNTFTSVDLWNIQKQVRTAYNRRRVF